MPELPEVEHAAGRLRSAMVGRVIVAAETFHRSTAQSLTPQSIRRLIGQPVVSVDRRAKIQLVSLGDGQLLEVHFRMTGDWEFGQSDDPTQPLERARFALDDGTRVSFIDGRAFGVLRLHAAGTFSLPPLGPEPLETAFDAKLLRGLLASRRGPIKPVLLDQRVVAGLGNIYAAEALWEARISPASAANSLGPARVSRLRDAIQLVLRDAPVGRYYARDDVDGNMAPSDDEHWRVYGREGQQCRRCDGRIVRIVQAGRSTFYCRRCQR